MFEFIKNLKLKGYEPTKIFDIGAHHGLWTKNMLNIYSNCEYYLYEAIEYDELNNFVNINFNMKKFNVLLNDKVDTVKWYQMKNTGDSMFRERTPFFENCDIIERTTIDLDTHIKNNIIINEDDHILIKIDTQGAEIPILKGASNILKYTDFILLELPFFGKYNEGVPTFLEHIQYMDSIGFVPYDIYDRHILNGFVMQLDMMFINKNHNFTKLVN
jgi:FkbM family methyltransferase